MQTPPPSSKTRGEIAKGQTLSFVYVSFDSVTPILCIYYHYGASKIAYKGIVNIGKDLTSQHFVFQLEKEYT